MVGVKLAGQVLGDHETVAGDRRRRGQDAAEPHGAEALDQAAPRLDRAGDGDGGRPPDRHAGEASFAHRLDGRPLTRAARALEPDRAVGAGRPDQREEVAADARHVRVDDAHHRVGRDRGVDRVAPVAEHLRARLGGEVVAGGYDPLQAARLGVMIRIAPGTTSKVAGRLPTISPSSWTSTGTWESTSTRRARKCSNQRFSLGSSI